MGGTKYLKMPTDFFENEAIDFLLSQKQGTKYVTLYIMLCLKSLNTIGKLVCQVGEMLIPYNVEWIQKDCKYFSKNTIKSVLELFIKLGLIRQEDEETLQLQLLFEKYYGKW